MTMPIDSTDDKDTELLSYLLAGRNHAQTLKTIRLEFYRLRDIQHRQRRAALANTIKANHPRRPMEKPTSAPIARTTRADRPYSAHSILRELP